MPQEICGYIVKRGLWSADFRTLCPRVPHTTKDEVASSNLAISSTSSQAAHRLRRLFYARHEKVISRSFRCSSFQNQNRDGRSMPRRQLRHSAVLGFDFVLANHIFPVRIRQKTVTPSGWLFSAFERYCSNRRHVKRTAADREEHRLYNIYIRGIIRENLGESSIQIKGAKKYEQKNLFHSWYRYRASGGSLRHPYPFGGFRRRHRYGQQRVLSL